MTLNGGRIEKNVCCVSPAAGLPSFLVFSPQAKSFLPLVLLEGMPAVLLVDV